MGLFSCFSIKGNGSSRIFGRKGNGCEEKREMEKEKYSNVPFFSFDGIKTKAYVTKVYDGDTIHIVFKRKLGFFFTETVKVRCRLLGIDAPEVKGPEKELGIPVRDHLRARILHKEIGVHLGINEKYGRTLATIFDSYRNIKKETFESSINHYFLQKGYVKPYPKKKESNKN